jgi:hypothetical protein
MMRAFKIWTFNQHFGDQIKEDVMGRHITCISELRNAYKILVGKPKENNQSRDLGADGKIILTRLLKKKSVRM